MHTPTRALVVGLLCAGLTAACQKPSTEPTGEKAAPEKATPEKATPEKATPETAVKPAAAAQDPWALPPAPPKSVYDGPLFAMSHAYPDPPLPPPANQPWRTAIDNKPITTANAAAYAAAAKQYVADQGMKTLLFDYPSWDAAKAGWFNMPWLTNVREPILGTYIGSSFPPEMFPISKLTTDMTTLVLVYYDQVAAGVSRRIWGTSGNAPLPGIKSGGAQYVEGSVIVKAAYSTALAKDWPPMTGAQIQQVYANVSGDDIQQGATLMDVSLFQFDIIIKDSQSSPRSQWVFMTLVYDQSVQSADPWDKMVPLGVMWGNDPDVNSPIDCNPLTPGSCPALQENWINPAAPVYAKETLGWGGRLSGPNDGAVNLNNAIEQADGSIVPFDGRLAMSSCMGCHGAAEFEQGDFLLPAVNHCQKTADSCSPVLANCTGNTCTVTNDPGADSRLVFHAPGGEAWMQWFQDRPGTQAQNPPATALDYGMNLAFKALPTWLKANGQAAKSRFAHKLSDYRGVPMSLVRRR